MSTPHDLAGTVLLAATSLAQMPSHAVLLNPTTPFANTPLAGLQTGDEVHVFGLTAQPWPSQQRTLRYARSSDGGRTWPIREVPIATTWNQVMAAVVTPSGLLVVGYDTLTGPVALLSTDADAPWPATTSLTTTPEWQGYDRRLAVHVDGAVVVVVFTKNDGRGWVWANRSTDGGLTWQGDQAITPPPPVTGNADDLVIVGDGPVLHATWSHQASFQRVTVCQRSTDGGHTWLPEPQLLGLGRPRSLAGDATVLLLAMNNGAGLRSTDGGQTWGPMQTSIPDLRAVALQGSTALAVGLDTPTSAPTWLFSRSTDGGATWQNVLTLPSYGSFHATPSIVDGTMFVHFTDTLFQAEPGLVAQSIDNGVSWRGVSGPVSGGFLPGPARSVHLAWSTPPGLGGQMMAYVGMGHTPRGSGSPGTGGLAPQLSGHGLSGLGATTTLTVTHALPNTLGLLGVATQPATPTPLGSWTLWLAGPVSLQAFATGAGTWSLPLQVPASPALVGAQLTSQAVIVDGGAPGGLAASNALETWLR